MGHFRQRPQCGDRGAARRPADHEVGDRLEEAEAVEQGRQWDPRQQERERRDELTELLGHPVHGGRTYRAG